jgi:hypothetical protein
LHSFQQDTRSLDEQYHTKNDSLSRFVRGADLRRFPCWFGLFISLIDADMQTPAAATASPSAWHLSMSMKGGMHEGVFIKVQQAVVGKCLQDAPTFIEYKYNVATVLTSSCCRLRLGRHEVTTCGLIWLLLSDCRLLPV